MAKAWAEDHLEDGTIAIRPLGDGFDHSLPGLDCPCGPVPEKRTVTCYCFGPQGYMKKHVVHKAQDGRKKWKGYPRT